MLEAALGPIVESFAPRKKPLCNEKEPESSIPGGHFLPTDLELVGR